MSVASLLRTVLLVCVCLALAAERSLAEDPDPEIVAGLQSGLNDLQATLADLQQDPQTQTRDGRLRFADVAVFAKAVEWMLRHNEFPKKDFAKQAAAALRIGGERAAELKAGNASWEWRSGQSIRGYVSSVDGSLQPYAVTLPEAVNSTSGQRWPLQVVLHGRANDMNEVNFISKHEGKALPDGQNWIQLDVYGRGNNAYRWAGESDVFEAMSDVRRRFRIDDHRITLRGFSMGGAGSWHLGLHHPATWSSVGPGAGFVDFYKYQKHTERLPEWQHQTLGVYDALDYALNAANVPVCAYGGELDPQAASAIRVTEAAKALDVDVKLLIGPGMGHKFHPDSFKEYMAFHKEKSEAGRLRNHGRKRIRFTTRTLKYNKCDWVTIEEMEQVYEPATIEAEIRDSGTILVSTTNVAVFSVSRDIAQFVDIDDQLLPCSDAADGLLPNVFYEKSATGWYVQTYDESRAFSENPDLNKRHGLQGPIDDAFMSPFVCVLGDSGFGEDDHGQWANWTFNRFQSEFDKWMRARIPVVNAADVSEDDLLGKNLVLFGDATSNQMIQKVLPGLPVQWTSEHIKIGDKVFDAKTHGLSMIYPNPLSRGKYVVINSGHTFHEQDFKNSNSWLFPRLGDIAVQKFTRNADGGFDEEIVWAANFNSGWGLSEN